MRPSRSILIALASLVLAGAVAEPAQARPRRAFAPAPVQPVSDPLVSLEVVQPGGASLPAFMHLGSLYVAGAEGQHYGLRLTNNSGERLEVVVTVDGRDVVSGELGNYKRQRGYVLEAYSTVVVDGFRQSLDHVAAFQFTNLENSYTAQRGTPQNAGVIGVAVFKESRRSARRYRKQLEAATPPPPVYEPYYRGTEQRRAPSAFPDAGATSHDESAEDAPAAAKSRDFAPRAQPRQLGTGYGATQHSSVQEVAFKRHRRRRPDAFVTVYYDSMVGLQARGVTTQPTYQAPPPPRPRGPYVAPGFAQPPPYRR
ncbi:MAG: hypothetical protein AAF799_17765 [Myxococcota bacterium]